LYLQTTPSSVLAVLRDAEAFAVWVPWLRRCSLLAREEGASVVEVEVRGLGQRALLFEAAESDESVAFRQLGNYRRQGIRGSVRIERAESSGVTVEASAEVSGKVPFFGRRGVRQRVERLLDEALHALDLRTQKLDLGAVGSRQAAQLKLLEIRETRRGLSVWFAGRTYDVRLESREGGTPPTVPNVSGKPGARE
jgi:carbon monoxide dehydrogenase subunit G